MQTPPPQNAPGGYAAPPPAGPSIRFDVIGQAFNMVFSDIGTWAVAGIFMLLAIGVAYAVMWVPLTGVMMSGSFILTMLVGAIMMFVVMAIANVMLANMYRMAMMALSGTKPSVNEMFKFGGNIANIFVASLLVAIFVSVASIFCYIPGFVVGGLLMFTMPLVVDRNLPAMDAIKLSMETLKKDVVMATIFYFVIAICAGIGGVACGIGLAFTFPVLPIAVSMLYRDYLGFASVGTTP